MKLFSLLLIGLLFLGCQSKESTQDMKSTPKELFNITLSPQLAAGHIKTAVPITADLIVLPTVFLDPATITPGTPEAPGSLYIVEEGTEEHPSITLSIKEIGDKQYITIRPDASLKLQTDYTIVMTPAVMTQTGEHRETNAVITFTTDEGDTTPPRLVDTLPQAGRTHVQPYTTIYFQFNEPLSPESLTGLELNVTDGESTHFTGTLSLSGALLSFVPDTNFTGGAHYDAELNTSTLRDLSGNFYREDDGEAMLSTDFTITSYETDLDPFSGTADYNLSAQANCIEDNNLTLFVGTDDGLDVLYYDPYTTTTYIKPLLHINGLGSVYSIDLNMTEQRAYIGSSTGFSIVDISDLNDPNKTRILSNWDNFGAPVYNVFMQSEHVYLAGTTEGVTDLNISDETNPTVLIYSDTDEKILPVDLFLDQEDTTHLVISDYTKGIYTLDTETLSVMDYLSYQFKGEIHNIFTNYLFSAGIAGIGSNGEGILYSPAASYVTRIYRFGQYSTAIIRDIGIGFFNADNSSRIGSYERTSFDISAIGYLVDNTDGAIVIIISDTAGHLYIIRKYIAE